MFHEFYIERHKVLPDVASWANILLDWSSNFNDTPASGMRRNSQQCTACSITSDLSGWDTSNVVDMDYMFCGATSFNRDLSGWDTSKVTDMQYMFEGASSFNSDLST